MGYYIRVTDRNFDTINMIPLPKGAKLSSPDGFIDIKDGEILMDQTGSKAGYGLQSDVKWLATIGVTGYVTFTGEEGETWRIVLNADGTTETKEATIVWS